MINNAKENITSIFKALQQTICEQLEVADGTGVFDKIPWDHAEGGGGITRILSGGKVIEKGGVNFSAVNGKAPEAVMRALEMDSSAGQNYFATGISIVLHPFNPNVPIIHMNVRYFEMDKIWWFGGGIDLTPHYVYEDDARFFHEHLKNVCDKHNAAYYPKFKDWADRYFYIKHRNETRGIGGIFFDQLKDDEGFTFESRLEFIKDVALSFAPIYTQLMKKNKNQPFGEKEKQWQALRRGRYVEFNLVYDRGTKFGLETSGRTESILMSLPPVAQWKYDYHPEKGSREEETLGFLKPGIKWV